MMPLTDAALTALVAWSSFVSQSQGRAVSPPLPAVDTVSYAQPSLTIAAPAGLTSAMARDTITPADTVLRKPRQKAFVYSEAYETRLTIHRRMSWAMLPLFALSYVTGDQLIKKNTSAPTWAKDLHGPAATGSAILFGANTITGAWNLWEGRHDPNGRTRKILHSVLFTAASAGFVYAGTQLANDAEQSQSKRIQHKNVAVYSMGVSTFSWLIMLIGN